MSNLTVALHEKIVGTDGAYDFDATVRYQFAGMSFLVVVEAKLHKNPIKRELVQVLQQKVRSLSPGCVALPSRPSRRAGSYLRPGTPCLRPASWKAAVM